MIGPGANRSSRAHAPASSTRYSRKAAIFGSASVTAPTTSSNPSMPTSASSGTAVIARATLRASSLVRQPVRPPAAPPSSRTSNGRPSGICSSSRRSSSTPLKGIDQAQELESGVGLQFGEHGADRLAADQLIGHEHTRHAEPTAHHQLLHGGDGDAPGAVGELPGEQLRRHGGLAVRAQAHIELLEKAAHPAAVVRERGSLEHRDRERQVLAQQVPALAPGGAQRQRSGQRRPALGRKRYRRVQQLVQVHRKSPHPPCVTSGGIIVRHPADHATKAATVGGAAPEPIGPRRLRRAQAVEHRAELADPGADRARAAPEVFARTDRGPVAGTG